jgi:hypothetical protein
MFVVDQLNLNTGALREEIAGYINMPETGDYAADCATGRRFADAIISRMSTDAGLPMLASVTRGAVDLGRWTPMHAGFYQRIAEHCVRLA